MSDDSGGIIPGLSPSSDRIPIELNPGMRIRFTERMDDLAAVQAEQERIDQARRR